MFTGLITYFAEIVINVISSMGYLGIFITMSVEGIGIPIPSEVVMPFVGYIVSTGEINFILAVFVGTTGAMVGALILYWIGMKGGRPFIEKYGKYILITHHDMDIADVWFAKHGKGTIFFTRMIPLVRTFISLPAGIARMPMKVFIPYTFFGSLIWSTLLTFIGLKMGENWSTLSEYFKKADLFMGIVTALLIGWYIWRHIRNLKK